MSLFCIIRLSDPFQGFVFTIVPISLRLNFQESERARGYRGEGMGGGRLMNIHSSGELGRSVEISLARRLAPLLILKEPSLSNGEEGRPPSRLAFGIALARRFFSSPLPAYLFPSPGLRNFLASANILLAVRGCKLN